MTWARLDDAILDNPKIIRAGPIGFALHVAAITWCARNLTDGFVPEAKSKQLLIQTWTEDRDDGRSVVWELNASSGHAGLDADEAIDQVIEILMCGGLWRLGQDDRGNLGYWLNDYLDYNPSRAEVLAEREKKRLAGRIGGARSAKARAQTGAQPQGQANQQAHAQAPAQAGKQAQGKQNSTPVPVPVPEEDPPTPLPDRLEQAFTGGLPHQREDVADLFRLYKTTFGLADESKLIHSDGRAYVLAQALDAYGWDTCALVLGHAKRDGMVNGKQDEHGQKHETIQYILGNPNTFDRILKAAKERDGKSGRKLSATEAVEAARRL